MFKFATSLAAFAVSASAWNPGFDVQDYSSDAKYDDDKDSYGHIDIAGPKASFNAKAYDHPDFDESFNVPLEPASPKIAHNPKKPGLPSYDESYKAPKTPWTPHRPGRQAQE